MTVSTGGFLSESPKKTIQRPQEQILGIYSRRGRHLAVESTPAESLAAGDRRPAGVCLDRSPGRTGAMRLTLPPRLAFPALAVATILRIVPSPHNNRGSTSATVRPRYYTNSRLLLRFALRLPFGKTRSIEENGPAVLVWNPHNSLAKLRQSTSPELDFG